MVEARRRPEGRRQPKRADPTGCLPEFDRSLPGELLSSAPSWQAISLHHVDDEP